MARNGIVDSQVKSNPRSNLIVEFTNIVKLLQINIR